MVDADGLTGTTALVNQLYGSAATMQNIQSSPYYDSLIDAISNGDWQRANDLVSRIYNDVLMGADDKTAIDAQEWLDNLVDHARRKMEEEGGGRGKKKNCPGQPSELDPKK